MPTMQLIPSKKFTDAHLLQSLGLFKTKAVSSFILTPPSLTPAKFSELKYRFEPSVAPELKKDNVIAVDFSRVRYLGQTPRLTFEPGSNRQSLELLTLMERALQGDRLSDQNMSNLTQFIKRDLSLTPELKRRLIDQLDEAQLSNKSITERLFNPKTRLKALEEYLLRWKVAKRHKTGHSKDNNLELTNSSPRLC